MSLPLAFLAMTACASRTLRVPGPLGPVAEAPPPPVHVRDLPVAEAEEPTEVEPRRDRRKRSGFGDQVADAARHHLTNAPSGFRNDCSGFVMAAHHKAGHPLSGSTRSLWALAESTGGTFQKRPEPGDVAFFDNTYDRNRNGRRDDALTHVAVVLEVGEDGTLLLAHAGTSKGRTTLRMNLDRPHDRLDEEGNVLNDWLRARRKGESENAPRLSAELFKGFARFPPDGA